MDEFLAKFPTYDIWITEVGCQDFSGANIDCTQDMANAMLDGALAYVAKTLRVKRWAWYGT